MRKLGIVLLLAFWGGVQLHAQPAESQPRKEYYPNGNLRFETIVEGGSERGYKAYFEDGALAQEVSINPVTKDEYVKDYYRAGKLLQEYEKRGTTMTNMKRYYPDGKLQWSLMEEKTDRNAKAIEMLQATSPAGENAQKVKLYEARYDEEGRVFKTGLWKSYSEDGKIISEMSYKDSKKHGIAKYYDANGQVVQQESYDNDKKVN